MTRSGSLERPQSWYAANCDGEWEHQRGVKIDTLDNPGWDLEVDLVGTPLEGRTLVKHLDERSEEDWVSYNVEKSIFGAAGGAENLAEMVDFFLAWAEEDE
jgi:hypothetical protein